MKIFRDILASSLVLGLLCIAFVHAGHAAMGEEQRACRDTVEGFPAFETGDLSFQFLAGALFSPAPLVARTDVFDYAQVNLRLGMILAGFDHSAGARRSIVEGLVEITNSWVFSGYGNYLSGVTLMIRYSHATAGSPFVPYVQAGVGAVYSDACKEFSQTAIGNDIEFTPQASLGLHWFIGTRWSFDGEVMFQHISNAGLDERNGGINAAGGFVGATYYFDAPGR